MPPLSEHAPTCLHASRWDQACAVRSSHEYMYMLGAVWLDWYRASDGAGYGDPSNPNAVGLVLALLAAEEVGGWK